MENIKLKIGKYYLLDSRFPHWCVNIQRSVIFDSPLVVKFTHGVLNEEGGFGELVDVGKGAFCTDLQTNTEIEFSADDVIKEYQFNDNGIIFYMEFLS